MAPGWTLTKEVENTIFVATFRGRPVLDVVNSTPYTIHYILVKLSNSS